MVPVQYCIVPRNSALTPRAHSWDAWPRSTPCPLVGWAGGAHALRLRGGLRRRTARASASIRRGRMSAWRASTRSGSCAQRSSLVRRACLAPSYRWVSASTGSSTWRRRRRAAMSSPSTLQSTSRARTSGTLRRSRGRAGAFGSRRSASARRRRTPASTARMGCAVSLSSTLASTEGSTTASLDRLESLELLFKLVFETERAILAA